MVTTPADSIHPRTRTEWRDWLSRHHDQAKGVWLVGYKKATGLPRVEYDEAVEEALSFGWVDSKTRALDQDRTMLRFSPRKAGSGWSRSNKERVERVMAAGLMTPAGLAKIEAAKRDGSWYALDSVEALEVPPDLAASLAANEAAKQHFDAFSRAARRAILQWIAGARTSQTRERRIAATVASAARNVRADPSGALTTRHGMNRGTGP